MPHPINNPVGLAARGGPRIVLERPALAMLIGAIAAEWGEIDAMLGEIFNFVSLSKPSPSGGSKSELAGVIFDSLVSFQVRTEVIASVMRLRMQKDIQDEFSGLVKKIRSRTKARNTLVHSAWQVCDAYPKDLIRIVDGAWIRYTESNLKHDLDVSVALRNEVNDFTIKVAFAPKVAID
ncbi:hypothetical protein [Mesorhizobium caraganae]|uniref:hypothetical protein n=1 Tax=Mesorhizobium caraganae TaxID=483206 RepID=UPI00333DCB6B